MIGWDGCVVGWTGLGWSDPDWLGLGWSDPDSNPCHTPTSRRISNSVQFDSLVFIGTFNSVPVDSF